MALQVVGSLVIVVVADSLTPYATAELASLLAIGTAISGGMILVKFGSLPNDVKFFLEVHRSINDAAKSGDGRDRYFQRMVSSIPMALPMLLLAPKHVIMLASFLIFSEMYPYPIAFATSFGWGFTSALVFSVFPLSAWK
ncbi:MAG: hypothetical protein HY057_08595 [Rhodospirillales bacterium]|nr:hypothetical protein [Rhodospirillales bacterium]